MHLNDELLFPHAHRDYAKYQRFHTKNNKNTLHAVVPEHFKSLC